MLAVFALLEFLPVALRLRRSPRFLVPTADQSKERWLQRHSRPKTERFGRYCVYALPVSHCVTASCPCELRTPAVLSFDLDDFMEAKTVDREEPA